MPCRYKNAADELDRIVEEGKYIFNPLVALDNTRRLILPTKYEHELSGATVLVRMSLTCDLFRKGLQFYAEIESLNVLCPPKSLVALPPSATPSRKRKVELAFLTMNLKKKKNSSFKGDQDNEENPPPA
jgi:hypothetical protein